jgi:hypothetical protein
MTHLLAQGQALATEKKREKGTLFIPENCKGKWKLKEL